MIVRRSQAEIAKLRRANQLVGTVLATLRAMVAPGVTTDEIDAVAEAMVREAGATPAFKGYHGYPATVCASVNEQVVHGIPSRRVLVAGDIVSLDMGAVLDGYYGDSAVTVAVGEISAQAKELLRVTEESLFRGIDTVRPGFRWCGSSWDTASGPRSTKSPRCPTTVPADRGRGWPRAWYWPSSRW
jgi:methionyl aminopeptidase